MKDNIQAVVFDMDGVLFDTERIYMETWREVATEARFPKVDIEKAVVGCVGLNATDTRALFAREYGQDFPTEEYLKACSLRFHEKIDKDGLPFKTGVLEILSSLKESGCPIALASSTRTGSVMSHLEKAGITDYFQKIIGGDMVTHSKPAPDIYLMACEALSTEPYNAVAVEDSPNGIYSAHAAGMKVIMVPDMIAPTAEIEKLLYAKCETLLDVKDLLLQGE